MTAFDGESLDSFGVAVATDGSSLLVGAHLWDGPAGLNSGAVYSLVLSGGLWSHSSVLQPGDASAGDNFGSSLSLQGGTLVVGAAGVSSRAGAVYVFSAGPAAGTWTEGATKLVAPAGAGGGEFGSAVALGSQGLLAVGSPGSNSGQGIVYLYEQSTADPVSFTYVAALTADDGAAQDNFGGSVAASGALLLVGAILGRSDAGTRTGKVYQFEYGSGEWRQTLTIAAAGALTPFSPNCLITTPANSDANFIYPSHPPMTTAARVPVILQILNIWITSGVPYRFYHSEWM